MKKLLVSSLFVSSLAYAGGYTFPDNGTEALGRGAAFTAKADDATALEYNVAGLATQRGTRLLLDANLAFHTYEFQRSGSYPMEDVPPGEMGSGVAGLPFPKVSNLSGPQFAPFLGVTTDFGKFERWTFAIGVFAPSSYGQRNFGTTVQANGMTLPAPSRYDLVQTNLLIVLPTIAAAVRATKWLDIGVGLHLVVGHFDLQADTFSDIGPGVCYSKEFPGCDALTHIVTTGVTATASLGFMFHPVPVLDIGINLLGKANVDTSGSISTPGPSAIPLDPMHLGDCMHGHNCDASFHTSLPWELRLGLRYKFLKNGFEHGDIEIDAVYQAWKDAETRTGPDGKTTVNGDTLDVPQLAFFSEIHTAIVHNYQDTVSVRLGGAYNLQLPRGVLTLRLGTFYDSAATKQKDTRLDFDTMDKWGFTGGLGYKIRGVAINVAYGYLFSPDRNVANGDILSLNGTSGTNTGSDGKPLPVINNGQYHAVTQILSIGLTLAFDEILKKNRVYTY
jgi:long-chain fatty acid transport protein